MLTTIKSRLDSHLEIKFHKEGFSFTRTKTGKDTNIGFVREKTFKSKQLQKLFLFAKSEKNAVIDIQGDGPNIQITPRETIVTTNGDDAHHHKK